MTDFHVDVNIHEKQDRVDFMLMIFIVYGLDNEFCSLNASLILAQYVLRNKDGTDVGSTLNWTLLTRFKGLEEGLNILSESAGGGIDDGKFCILNSNKDYGSLEAILPDLYNFSIKKKKTKQKKTRAI